ncbi:hypothetical protein [Bowdeniella nasicola]|uniref:hypothetical protein n=1 Tax=Bowdeniella nasicola TaxID=208480 RepID=UPI00115FBC91|nr:hypothetical protein [Bowdeniella nasicola]
MTPTLRTEVKVVGVIAAFSAISIIWIWALAATGQPLMEAIITSYTVIGLAVTVLPYVFGLMVAWRIDGSLRSGQSRGDVVLSMIGAAALIIVASSLVVLIMSLTIFFGDNDARMASPSGIMVAVVTAPLITFASTSILVLIYRRWGLAVLTTLLIFAIVIANVAAVWSFNVQAIWWVGPWFATTAIGGELAEPGMAARSLAAIVWWAALGIMVWRYEPRKRA